MYDNDQEYGWKSYDNQGYEGRPYNEPQFDQGPNFNQGPSGGQGVADISYSFKAKK